MKKLIPLIVLAAGGVAAWWFFVRKKPAATSNSLRNPVASAGTASRPSVQSSDVAARTAQANSWVQQAQNALGAARSMAGGSGGGSGSGSSMGGALDLAKLFGGSKTSDGTAQPTARSETETTDAVAKPGQPIDTSSPEMHVQGVGESGSGAFTGTNASEGNLDPGYGFPQAEELGVSTSGSTVGDTASGEFDSGDSGDSGGGDAGGGDGGGGGGGE